jgi:hypothetical protein
VPSSSLILTSTPGGFVLANITLTPCYLACTNALGGPTQNLTRTFAFFCHKIFHIALLPKPTLLVGNQVAALTAWALNYYNSLGICLLTERLCSTRVCDGQHVGPLKMPLVLLHDFLSSRQKFPAAEPGDDSKDHTPDRIVTHHICCT